MSDHRIEVVPVKLEKHPNADTLSIVKIKAYQVVVKTSDWEGHDKGIYIPPDYVVPKDATNEYLAKQCHVRFGRLQDQENWMEGYRIKTKKFRGEWSQGLLLIPHENMSIGQDVMSTLGIGRYEPPTHGDIAGEQEASPPGDPPVYDLESFYDHPDWLQPNEPIIITEKIHGTNARFLYTEDRFWCGSHRTWQRKSEKSIYWKALNQYPQLQEFLKANPGYVVYAEIYGDIQDLTYGMRKGSGDIKLAIFDVMSPNMKFDDTIYYGINYNAMPMVPTIAYDVRYTEKLVKELSSGKSILQPDQIREGIVIRPVKERFIATQTSSIHRLVLKAVSNEYLERQ